MEFIVRVRRDRVFKPLVSDLKEYVFQDGLGPWYVWTKEISTLEELLNLITEESLIIYREPPGSIEKHLPHLAHRIWCDIPPQPKPTGGSACD
jgi:hypothetical protein